MWEQVFTEKQKNDKILYRLKNKVRNLDKGGEIRMQRNEYHIGKLLRSIREEQKLSLNKVCYGLCAEETLMRMEEEKFLVVAGYRKHLFTEADIIGI